MTDATVARRFVGAFGRHDEALLDELYAEHAVLFHPLARSEGREAVKEFFAELHRGFPGMRVALHDEFYSGDRRRGCLRLRLEWQNEGSFHGHPATGQAGSMAETHSLRLDDGRIVEQIVGATSFQMPKLFLADWGMDFPRGVPDPQPAIVSASPSDPGGAGEERPLARRFALAFGARDRATLSRIYAEDVELYTPLGWPVRGQEALLGFVDEFHASNPGMRVALHDEFYDPDGRRACWRIRLHYRNTEPFYGNPATNDAGVMVETHSVTLEGGRIVRHVVGDNTFHMPYQELVLWKMEFPTDTPDPDPEIMAVDVAEPRR